jgi:hypothetical protein
VLRAIRWRTLARPALRTFLLNVLRTQGFARTSAMVDMFLGDGPAPRKRAAALSIAPDALLNHIVRRPGPERRLWRTEERELRQHLRRHQSHAGSTRRTRRARSTTSTTSRRSRRLSTRSSRRTSCRRRSRSRSPASDDPASCADDVAAPRARAPAARGHDGR